MWSALGAFILESGSITPSNALPITASWYAIITLVSFSSVSVTLSIDLAWSTNSLLFSFKFTKLSRGKYLVDLLSAWVMLSVFLISTVILFTALMFSISSKTYVFPGPLSFLKTFAVAMLVGIFFMLLAVMLVLLVTDYSNIKFVQFLSFIPMVLVFVLSYQLIYGSPSILLLYISPWDSAPSLLQATYLNSLPVNTFVSPYPKELSWPLALAGIVLWEVIIFALDVYLLKHIKPQEPEAMRQV